VSRPIIGREFNILKMRRFVRRKTVNLF
jgi:hypothetical protein